MASAYTGDKDCEGIFTTQGDGCISSFTGTSAASAQGTGIIALVLEANPELTYRDVMHLIAMSAEVAPLADNKGTWYQNGAGFWVSNDFGFGLMNAENMVNLAKSWVNVPERRTCFATVHWGKRKIITAKQSVKETFPIDMCEGTERQVNYLEHVELTSVVEFPYRGDIEVYLSSPSGTRTKLLERRPNDESPKGLESTWSIMTTHNWGEIAKGEWTVEYKINGKRSERSCGWVNAYQLKFHGTKERPEHYKDKRQYAPFRTYEGKTRFSEVP